MTTPTTHGSHPEPFYPEQGEYIAPDAVRTLLPVGAEAAGTTMLFIHAHPDDESTSTGATMSHYARAGARVELLTMSRGEMGEVIGDEHARLDVRTRPSHDTGDELGHVREGELNDACRALGVRGHRFARRNGAAGFFRDSGMSWGKHGRAESASNAADDCLSRARLKESAAAIAEVIEELRPDVVVSYDVDGGYGHPDHRRTHEATIKALHMLPAHALPVLVWGVEGEADPDDERQQAVVDGDAATKKLAMAAHQTQVTVGEDMTFHYSNGVEQKISGRETYRLLARVPHDDEDPSEREPAGPVSSSVTGLSLGLIVGFIGTLFHASIGYFSGWYLPWGLVLALILVLSATVWTAHVTRRAWATVLPGVSAFILVGFFVYARSDSLLVIPNPSVAIGQVGIAWVLGIVAMTLLGEWIANRHILRSRR
ncbi:PIG-L family deacetylase [uncultured Kocuria sp.]|uniref:PIG-L family deacetylase n=1 Tax=uncultured Kocuria sp. TaxID=259305 RepID=UPI000661576B|nr:PIG-L family deacetylase [uncultured Kocuria sp.]MCT1367489.1 PIG-L family deacetylase [Rothia sp. p3-SID1597]